MVTTTSLGRTFQYLITLTVKKIPPDVQPKPSLAQLKTLSSHPVAGCLGEEATLHLAKPPFR